MFWLCLACVLVVSSWCLGGVSWCLGSVIVVSRLCSVVSWWYLGVVPVVSWWYLGCVLVVTWWYLGGILVVSGLSGWCLGSV